MATLRQLRTILEEEISLDGFGRRRRRDSEGAFPLVVGVVSGTLLGAIVAVLFTPRTGREMRSRLIAHTPEPVEHAFERVAAVPGQVRDQAGRLSSSARDRAQSLVHRGGAASEDQPEGEPQQPGLRERLKLAWQEAVEAGKEAARERAAEERAYYRELTGRPDALKQMEE